MPADVNMGLFENCREANLVSTVAMVEDVLVQLGVFLNDCRDAPTAQGLSAWRMAKGSAVVRIALVEGEDGRAGEYHLRVTSVVMTMDRQVDETGLYRHILELNAGELAGCAFGVCGDEVVLVAQRPTLDLDRSEVYDLITCVRDHADEFDDKLVAAFGGRMGARS